MYGMFHLVAEKELRKDGGIASAVPEARLLKYCWSNENYYIRSTRSYSRYMPHSFENKTER